MEGPEVASAEQDHSVTGPPTSEPEAQALPQTLETSNVQTPFSTCPPVVTKTYAGEVDVVVRVRFGIEQI